jgi:ethanolamine utilization microcompartment shell protein EutS
MFPGTTLELLVIVESEIEDIVEDVAVEMVDVVVGNTERLVDAIVLTFCGAMKVISDGKVRWIDA